MTFPLVRDLAADEIPVAVTCRVLGFSRQAFYAWDKNPVSDRDLDDAYLTNAALDVHADDPEFGYRFVADELAAAGHIASSAGCGGCARRRGSSRRTAAGAASAKRPGRRSTTTWSSATSPPTAPNQLWLTDITEHHTDEGKLYLCAIKDVYSARIVGYSIDSRMKTRIAVNALSSAVARRGGPAAVAGCTVHSDRGSQFRSRRFVEELKHHGLTGSMGRVGAAGDNAAMESFFALLQKNVLNRQRWRTREELRLAIVTWIERTYHRRRRQRALGKLTPIEFETIYAAADAA